MGDLRTMISTWIQLLKREFQWRKLSLDHDQPQQFAQSQWQCTTRLCAWLFLAYRCFLATFLLVALILSIVEVFHFDLPPAKWLIYATDWSFFSLTAQAVLAAIIVIRYQLMASNTSENVMNSLYKSYWVLNNVSNVLALAVSLGYWAGVYNPQIDSLDFVNMSTHAANTLIVLVDLFISAHPIQLLHAYQPICVAAAYLVFSGVYYVAGGTDFYGSPRLYPFLDWSKLGMIVILTPLAGILLAAIHAFLWLLYLLRCKVAEILTRDSGEIQPLIITQSEC